MKDIFRLSEKYWSPDYTAQEALKLGLIDKVETNLKFFGLEKEAK